jgi:hypothetical protein
MKSCDAQNYTKLCPYLERETGTEFRQWSGFSKIPFAIMLILNEVLRVEDVLIRKAREQQETSTGGRGHWRGSVPSLCLIMCLTQDNVKCLFLTQANSRSRQELDARNSDSR